MTRIVIVFFFITCFCSTVSAQGDYISIGFGPSMIYSDNSGLYREFKFKIQPAVSLSINKQLSEYVGLRGSLGTQIFNSGHYTDYNPNPKRIINWGNEDQAFGFKGMGYIADIMPVFTTNPNASGMLMSTIHFYAGLGFGLMYVSRDLEILRNGIIDNGVIVDGEILKTNETDFLPLIPLRTGLSTNLSGDWDFALEFVLITTLSSELDGNNIKYNQIDPDMSGQILFTVKRYFGSAW